LSTPAATRQLDHRVPADERAPRTRDVALHGALAGALVAGIGYVVLAACAVGIGFLLTDVILPGSVQRWDTSVVRTLADARPDFDTPTLVGSYLAEFATVLVVGGIGVAIALWRRWFRLAVFYVTAICIEGAVYVTATYFVSRTRPHVPRLEHLIVTDSYPSGHVAAGVVLWCFLALLVWNATHNRWIRGAAIVVAAAAPVIVALSRMYRGMHHPTDVIVGYAIGWGCVLVGYLAVRAAWEAAERHRARGDVVR
jgi:undecaprenyl-diphosphatase